MNDEFGRQLDGLRRRFARELPGRRAAIEDAWKRFREAGTEPDLRALGHHVHQLAGTAGSFGMSAVSAAAFAVERSLDTFERARSPSHLREVEEGVRGLLAAIEKAGSSEA